MQRIGSEECRREVDFEISERRSNGATKRRRGGELRFFSRLDRSLYGATYMVLAPEHSLVEKIATAQQRPAVEQYRASVAANRAGSRLRNQRTDRRLHRRLRRSSRERGADSDLDRGLRSDGIWNRAIMAVPAHDQRDFESRQNSLYRSRKWLRRRKGEAASRRRRLRGKALRE